MALGHPLGATGTFSFLSTYLICRYWLLNHVVRGLFGRSNIQPNFLYSGLGARCVSTLLNEMKRRGKDCRFGVISMCIGMY